MSSVKMTLTIVLEDDAEPDAVTEAVFDYLALNGVDVPGLMEVDHYDWSPA